MAIGLPRAGIRVWAFVFKESFRFRTLWNIGLCIGS